jgi:hypothetical protein
MVCHTLYYLPSDNAWWRPKTTRVLEIKAKIIKLHLVGYIYTYWNTMHSTMNLKFKESIYCDISGRMFNSLNRFLQDSVTMPHNNPNCLFLHSKCLSIMRGISPEYYSMSHYSVEKGMVNHNNSICIYIGINRCNYIASGTQFIY